MTLEAERAQVFNLEERLERLEWSERLENEALQKDNEKLQEEFFKVNQELHQTQIQFRPSKR